MFAWSTKQSGDWSVAATVATSPWYDNDAQTARGGIPNLAGGDTVTVDHSLNIDVNLTTLNGITSGTGGMNIAVNKTVGSTADVAVSANYGTITTVTQNSVVGNNDGGTITTNSGTVSLSSGTIGTVTATGVVTANSGTINHNAGAVTDNTGTVSDNTGAVGTNIGGTVHNSNGSTVTDNSSGTVYASGISTVGGGTVKLACSTASVNMTAAGTLTLNTGVVPAAGNVKAGVAFDGTLATTGTRIDCPQASALYTGTAYYGDPASKLDGTWHAPTQAGVSEYVTYGVADAITGGLSAAKIMDVTYGTLAAGSVLSAAGGTFDEAARNSDPGITKVLAPASGGPTNYKIANATLVGTATLPAAGVVNIAAAAFGVGGNGTTPTCHVPTAAQVLLGFAVGVSATGTVTLPNTDGSTPDAELVLSTAHYGPGNATAGTYVEPVQSKVLNVASGGSLYGAASAIEGGFDDVGDDAAQRAAQLLADQAEVNNNKGAILSGQVVLTGSQAGTLPPPTIMV
jgi:hypothetical protein